MILNITKMHANGNDFIFLDYGKNSIPDDIYLTKIIRGMCHRRFGAGADGVVTVEVGENEIFFRYFNRDGSEAGICGNALRCFSRYVVEEGYAPEDNIIITTTLGKKKASIISRREWIVETYIGIPKKTEVWGGELEGFTVYSVDIGVPHAVIFVEDAEVDVEEIGKAIRYSSVYPEGANVNFAKKLSEDTLLVRTYERGVEKETLSCGTGAVSTVYVVKELNIVEKNVNPVYIRTAGGVLQVVGKHDGYYIRGEAKRVYDARIYIHELAEV